MPLRGDNIILTGFMGSGKTVVGRALARIIGWKYADLDGLVSRRAGMSVKEIFGKKGEPAFRRLEHSVIRGISSMHRHVLAAGGGAPTFRRNRPWLRRGGTVVYLRVPVPVLVRRLRRSTGRPLIASARGDERALASLISGLLRKREASYRTADHVVAAGRGKPAEVARRIAALPPFRGLRRHG